MHAMRPNGDKNNNKLLQCWKRKAASLHLANDFSLRRIFSQILHKLQWGPICCGFVVQRSDVEVEVGDKVKYTTMYSYNVYKSLQQIHNISTCSQQAV